LHPAPMFEAMCRLNPCESINGTTPNYGPLLYALARALPAFNILEIGVAEGWCSGFMSWAVRENNTRFGMNGRFYGIDIDDKTHLQSEYDSMKLPATFISHPKGSVDYLRANPWPKASFDLMFIDGLHQVEYVLEEVKLLYPLLKGNGQGYLCFHDIYAFVEDVWPLLVKMEAPDINGVMKPAWEHIRFQENYGFGMLRKMEGYNYTPRHEYPDQTDYALAQGVIDKEKHVL
jgi:hypothetical protein